MTHQTDQEFTEDDLDRLDQFLMSKGMDEAMSVDELHGFLTAVLCTPELIPPSQWLAQVWGGEEPAFSSLEEAQDIVGMIMRLNNDVAARLSMGEFDPVFMEEMRGDGKMALAPFGWCFGFVQGMQLQPDAWRDETLNEFLMPIVILSESIEGDPSVNALLDDEEAIEEMTGMIPPAVAAIYEHQQKFFVTAPGGSGRTFKRSGAKVGRNDPCPCGSGKKYKKCCGSSTLH
jgi:uncharacterized protein